MRRLLVSAILLAACSSGDGGTGSPTIDAAPDAPPVPVEALAACPASVDATIEDSASAFVPAASTISSGGVVKFVITAEHFVVPNTLTTTDPALEVDRGETKCFRFNAPGTYGFLCGVHSFTGTITVQ